MSKKGLFIQGFIAGARAYLSADARIRERTSEGRPGIGATAGSLKENRFYYFDEEARAAFCHGVEDAAMEEGAGEFLVVDESFRAFEPHRERYEQLAVTVDSVTMAATGRAPQSLHRVRQVAMPKGRLRNLTLRSLTGRKASLMFCCQPAGKGGAGTPEYVGFFTTSPRLVARFAAGVRVILDGRTTGAQEFERLLAIDQTAKQIESDLNRQKDAVAKAMEKLQVEGGARQSGSVATELGKGASRLTEWKARLPAVLAEWQGR